MLITHAHADAILGMDDLRQFTHLSLDGPDEPRPLQSALTVYCDRETFRGLEGAFPYLVSGGQATGSGCIASLQFKIFEPFTEFLIPSHKASSNANDDDDGGDSNNTTSNTSSNQFISVVPIPVQHGTRQSDGAPYYANSFLINGSFYYVSDCSHTHERMPRLKGIDTLILDCLRMQGSFSSHLCWPQVKEYLEEEGRGMPPRGTTRGTRVVLVGLGHGVDYEEARGIVKQLQGGPFEVQVGFDGMLLTFKE